jgi:S1-C subfamily serine protease
VAMGNAEGQGSITAAIGHVTGLNQTITASDEGGSVSTETLHEMTQTNAGSVPGDSGGPLASAVGVIGMDTAGNDASYDQPATGFAIPINTALSVARRPPQATPLPPLPSATRPSWASSSAPARAAARRRRQNRSRTATLARAAPRRVIRATPARQLNHAR